MHLNTSLNQLLRLDTCISIFAAAVGTGGYLAGLFGMNLDNTEHIQKMQGLFRAICSITGFGILIFVWCFIKYLTHIEVLPKVRTIKDSRKTFGKLRL